MRTEVDFFEQRGIEVTAKTVQGRGLFDDPREFGVSAVVDQRSPGDWN